MRRTGHRTMWLTLNESGIIEILDFSELNRIIGTLDIGMIKFNFCRGWSVYDSCSTEGNYKRGLKWQNCTRDLPINYNWENGIEVNENKKGINPARILSPPPSPHLILLDGALFSLFLGALILNNTSLPYPLWLLDFPLSLLLSKKNCPANAGSPFLRRG